MSFANNGGSAFPAVEWQTHESGELYERKTEGMTLRDYFAAKAMQAWLVGIESPNIDKCAREAYEIADAMLEARK